MRMTMSTATALFLTALVGLPASAANALEVCENCVVVESSKKHKNVPYNRERIQSVSCPVGHFLTDVECTKSNNNFRFTGDGTAHSFKRVGTSFQVGAACVVRANKVRRDITLTTKASCQPPPSAGHIVFSSEKQNNVPAFGFRRHSVSCPVGMIMTRPFCYRSSAKFDSTAANATFTVLDETGDADSPFPVGRVPTALRCGVRSGGDPRIDTTITALATCVDFNDPVVMPESAQIVSNTEEREGRTTHSVSASCPAGTKAVAHRCDNTNNSNSQLRFSQRGSRATCSFETNKAITRGGSTDAVTLDVFCIDKQSGL